MRFFAKTRGLEAFELLPGILLSMETRSPKNKTGIVSSQKQNAVLTLPRNTNYNSCRTQKQLSHGVRRCWLRRISVQEQPTTYFEEAMG
jgi:hypothetical protein